MSATHRIVELDVRAELKRKLEPFQLIMNQVKTLQPDDTFVLRTTFKPTPLLALMKTKGFASKAEQIEDDHWVTTFVPNGRRSELEGAQADVVADSEDRARGELIPSEAATETTSGNRGSEAPGVTVTLDNRGLEPPQPMIRTLSALERCRPGETVEIHNDRVPMFLIEELTRLGYPYTIAEQPDGSARVTIIKK